jgi:hypothetical protein
MVRDEAILDYQSDGDGVPTAGKGTQRILLYEILPEDRDTDVQWDVVPFFAGTQSGGNDSREARGEKKDIHFE